jgi:hypothetical protein
MIFATRFGARVPQSTGESPRMTQKLLHFFLKSRGYGMR